MRAMKPTSNRWGVCATRRRTRARRDCHIAGRTPRLGRHAPRCTPRAATPGLHDKAPTRVSGNRLPEQRHVRDRAICNYRRRCCWDALESCPGGNDRKRAPWHWVRHGGCAERHRRNRFNLSPAQAHGQSRIGDPAGHPPRRPSRKCPAVPRAGAVHARRPRHGGGGAQRRAWTATSAARDSRTRWSAASTSRTGWIRGSAICAAHTPLTHCDTRHGQPWRERPLGVAWGHPQGTAWGSFTPWLEYRTQDGCRSHGRHTAPPDRSS